MTQPLPSPPRHSWYIVLLLTLLFAVSLVDRFILALLAAPLSRELGLTDIQLSLLIGTGFRRPYEGPAIGLLLAALCGLPIFSLATAMADHRLLLLGWGRHFPGFRLIDPTAAVHPDAVSGGVAAIYASIAMRAGLALSTGCSIPLLQSSAWMPVSVSACSNDANISLAARTPAGRGRRSSIALAVAARICPVNG